MPHRPALSIAAAVLALVAVLTLTPARAQHGPWVLLGTSDGTTGLRIAREHSHIARLRLEAEGADVHVSEVVVRHRDGRRQDLPIDRTIRAGRASPPLTLDELTEPVRRIDVALRSHSGGRIRIFAEIAADWQSGPGPIAPPVAAHAGEGFVVIDRRRIDPDTNRLVLRPGPDGALAGALKLSPEGADLFVRRVTLVYTSGEAREEAVGEPIADGGASRLIEVEAERGPLSEVVVVYRPSAHEREARLALLAAFRAAPEHDIAAPPAGSGREIDGLAVLAAGTIGIETRREVFAIGREAGRLGRIALRVSGNDVLLRQLTIVYGNGERTELPLEAEVAADTSTPPLELEGRRFVREIVLLAQANPDRRRPARVEVLGAR